MNTINLTSRDISCDHCKMTIEREVGALPGVEACEVDVAAQRVVVSFDPSRTSPERIVETLDEEGYPVAG